MVVPFHRVQEGALVARADLGAGNALDEREAELHRRLLRLCVRRRRGCHECADGDVRALGHQVLHHLRVPHDARPVQRRSAEEVLLIHIIPALHKERNAVCALYQKIVALPMLPRRHASCKPPIPCLFLKNTLFRFDMHFRSSSRSLLLIALK